MPEAVLDIDIRLDSEGPGDLTVEVAEDEADSCGGRTLYEIEQYTRELVTITNVQAPQRFRACLPD